MLRTISTAMLILAGAALVAVLVSLLAVRLMLTALFALSAIRRRTVREQVLSW